MTYIPSPNINQLSAEIGIPVSKIIKLDAGENPVVESLQNKQLFTKINLSLYPDPLCSDLRNKLSEYTQFPKESIACGNGSDELIDLLVRILVPPGNEIIVCPPTFPMYEVFARLSRVKVKYVNRTADLKMHYPNIIKDLSSKTRLIFIDSPGNPSGTVISIPGLKMLLQTRVLVVVDEAYFEYCNQTVLPLVNDYPNLIVLRTFSKWAGLAGLRLGYMVANPTITQKVLELKPPYSVNSFAQVAGCWALDNRQKLIRKIIELIKSRNKIIFQLKKLNMQVYPTQSAYIVFRAIRPLELQEFLRSNGVIVKLINQPLLTNCLRTNLGTTRQMARLIILIEKFYEKN